MTENRVPEWVYRSEIRPPETDEEPWAVDADDIEAHPRLRLLALVALIVAVALVFAVRGVR